MQKKKLFEIIFGAETKEGKLFDIALLIIIVISIFIVLLESVPAISGEFRTVLKTIEWVITIVFTIEYFLRIYIVEKPAKYVFSFYGLIDFFSFLPTYLAVFLVGAQSLIVLRALRLLRIFRVLKLTRYTSESNTIVHALVASKRKIGVFLYAVLTMVIIIGTIMYLIEGAENGFTSIPKSIYWAIVTLTTVGYGDIAPQTFLGQSLASIVMIIGYAIIAVPTGIVTAEIAHLKSKELKNKACSSCHKIDHDDDAKFCKSCGEKLG
jgi:voltage-gated potassium channel